MSSEQTDKFYFTDEFSDGTLYPPDLDSSECGLDALNSSSSEATALLALIAEAEKLRNQAFKKMWESFILSIRPIFELESNWNIFHQYGDEWFLALDTDHYVYYLTSWWETVESLRESVLPYSIVIGHDFYQPFLDLLQRIKIVHINADSNQIIQTQFSKYSTDPLYFDFVAQLQSNQFLFNYRTPSLLAPDLHRKWYSHLWQNIRSFLDKDTDVLQAIYREQFMRERAHCYQQFTDAVKTLLQRKFQSDYYVAALREYKAWGVLVSRLDIEILVAPLLMLYNNYVIEARLTVEDFEDFFQIMHALRMFQLRVLQDSHAVLNKIYAICAENLRVMMQYKDSPSTDNIKPDFKSMVKMALQDITKTPASPPPSSPDFAGSLCSFGLFPGVTENDSSDKISEPLSEELPSTVTLQGH